MEYAFDKEHAAKGNKSATNEQRHGQSQASNSSNQHHSTPSNSELLSSAKIVADAARAKLQNDPNHKFDQSEVAGAAENLLHAASHYGKLDEKGTLGMAVGKAENYLHQYHATTTTTNPDHSTTTTTTTTETFKPDKDHPATTTSTTETFHTKPGKDHHQEGHSGGGYGEYIKMAEGMLKKHSGSDGAGGEHGHNSGSGGYGEYIKMAGDFLKK